jgi:hypothetical protein
MENNLGRLKSDIQMSKMVDVVGVIMSYFGWNGMHNSNAPSSLQIALHR